MEKHFTWKAAAVASSLFLPLHPALAADPALGASFTLAQNTDALKSGQPYFFRAKRWNDGRTIVDFRGFRKDLLAGIEEHNKTAAKPLPLPTKLRLYVDNLVVKTVPFSTEETEIQLDPNEQYSLRIEAITDTGRVLERNENLLFEKKLIRAVNPASYEGEPEFFARSPRDAELKIDSSLSTLTQKIGRSKVVFVWKNPANPRLKNLQGPLDFRVIRDANGHVKSFSVTSEERKKKNLAPLRFSPKDAFVKVDAAFNENAFLWDDMFTCLHTLTFDSELCRDTVEFWLHVQKHQGLGKGDIPREVLKSNGTSFNLPELVHLGKTTVNGTYNNPNIMGDITEVLLDQGGLTTENRELAKAVLASMKAYAGWLDKNRILKDSDGKLAGYWISDLGSGMDNIGRAPDDKFMQVGYVDEFARRIELEKSAGRIEARLGNFAAMKKHFAKAESFDRIVNDRYWSPAKNFYYDLIPGPGGKLVRQEDMPTIAGFWPLFSRSASAEQLRKISENWYNDEGFGGKFPARSLPPIMAKLRPGSYRPEGGYWRGGNWPPTDIVKALGEERTGWPDLAADTIHRKLAADTYVAAKAEKELGRKTVYETLGTDKDGNPAPGIKVEIDGSIHQPRKDFVGWGGTPHSFAKVRHSLGIRPVPSFGGPSAKISTWIETITQNPAFHNSTYFGASPYRKEAAEKVSFAEGYLEITPPFALGEDPIELRNYEYRGHQISLRVKRPGGPSSKEVEVTISSEEPVRFNLAFVDVQPEGAKAGSPSAMSHIVKVNEAKGGSRTLKLELKPVAP